jgi:hypothetical protein
MEPKISRPHERGLEQIRDRLGLVLAQTMLPTAAQLTGWA